MEVQVNKQEYILITSAAEYVTGVERTCISTVASRREAKRFTKADADAARKLIKAKFDSGVEMAPA
jgi:hypothetical protein